MIITTEHLRSKRGCAEQPNLFRATFPDDMPVTLANIRTAQRAGLDVEWGRHLLPRVVWKACDEAIAAARKTCDEAIASALFAAAVSAGMAEE